MPDRKNEAEVLLDRLKDHPVIAVLVVIAIVLGGIASFTDSVNTIVSFFHKPEEPTRSSAALHQPQSALQQESPSLPDSAPPRSSTDAPIREASPEELVAFLDTLPPLQQDTIIATHYLGRSVSWQGKVETASRSGDNVLVHISGDAGPLLLVSITFDETWLPVVETLRRGDPVAYEGTLTGINGVFLDVEGTSVRRRPD